MLCALYQDLDDHGRFLPLNGWRAADDLVAARRTLVRTLTPAFDRIGAEVDRFEGHLRGSVGL